MTAGESTTTDGLATVRRDLGAATTQILGFTEMLQEQAGEAGQDALLADLQKIYVSGKHLVEVIGDLLGDAAAQQEDVDFARLRFEVRASLNHAIGYVEMLQERVQELEQREFVPDLERLHAACWQLLARADSSATQPPAANLPNGSSVNPDPQVPAYQESERIGGTLLVVDDNLQSRHLLAHELRVQGYRVIPVGSGLAAMERLRRDKFDLVLLDTVMPGMNGYEVLQWLKADPELRDIPVLMIAALNDTENVVRCLVIGADDYVTKPCDPVLLNTRVSHCLERYRLRLRVEALNRNS